MRQQPVPVLCDVDSDKGGLTVFLLQSMNCGALSRWWVGGRLS